MKITIIKKIASKHIYVKLITKKRKSQSLKLNFIIEQAVIDIDLNKYQYLQFYNDKMQTDLIILSENLQEITIAYNRKTKSYMAYISNNEAYGIIQTFSLKDEKNLFYRRDKKKKIHLLLPKDYDEKQKYGLIIAFDGQNLFDQKKVGKYTSKNDPYGSWQIDLSLANLKRINPNHQFIVCGIENADLYRELELSMNKNFSETKAIPIIADFASKGYLDNLDDFINETLLPYLIKNYAINQTKIGIMGSSCGGTACHYIGLKNHQKYQFIMCHTPASAFYLDEGWIEFYQKLDFKNQKSLPIFYYFQGKKGGLEKLLYTQNLNLVDNLIKNNYPKANILTYIEPKANHNEIAWRYSFNYAIFKITQILIEND